MDILLEKNKKALVIVSHPDDEIIWMGGMIMKNPQVEWTIYSLCRLSDTDREPKFRRVCEQLKARSIMTDLDDEGGLTQEESVKEIERLIKDNIVADDYDYVFTHGANGEYGHDNHISTHQAVKHLIEQNFFDKQMIYFFAYQKGVQEHSVVSSEEAEYNLELTEAECEKKKKIVADMYGYQYDGIDVGYCTNPESFTNSKY